MITSGQTCNRQWIYIDPLTQYRGLYNAETGRVPQFAASIATSVAASGGSPFNLFRNRTMSNRKKAATKDGLISQRVPLSTEKQMKRLAKNAKLPESVYLQMMVEQRYNKVFKIRYRFYITTNSCK